MRVSYFVEALRYASPDARAACFKVPDGLEDYLLFSESIASFAKPCPSDDGRFLVHSATLLGELASQVCAALLRELATALDRETEFMERAELGCDEWDDSQQLRDLIQYPHRSLSE